jgi:predicted HAD superfamily phosphohydrolase YqeG
MQCGRTLSQMADSAVARFQQRGIDVLCWDFDDTIIFLNTPQGTYPDLNIYWSA